MVHLYVGDGKGKSTACTGLAVRSLGRENSVLFCQFLKSGKSGEIDQLRKLGAEIFIAPHSGKFTFMMSEAELAECREINKKAFIEACEKATEGDYDLVIFDEVVDGINAGVIEEAGLLAFLRAQGQRREVVLSGRNPSEALIEMSDYYTEFVCRKHPYQKGVQARIGVEF